MTVIKEIISYVTGVNYSLNATIHSLLCPSMVLRNNLILT